MLSNLSQSSNFASPNPPKSFDTKEIKSKQSSSGLKCTPQKAASFIFRNYRMSRTEAFYALSLCHLHHPDYDLFAKEQEDYYATSLAIRKFYRCRESQKSSKPDHIKIDLLKQGLIDVVKLKGSREGRIKFSHKFLLEFTVYELQKKRQKLIDHTHLRMITEDDFKERREVETKILTLKKQIKEYKPKKKPKTPGVSKV